MDLKGSASPTLVLQSVRSDIAETKDGRINAIAPGVTAILVTSKEGTVLDFYHLWVEQATRVALHQLDENARDLGEILAGMDLLVGESVYLTPKVYYDAQELAGIVRGKWKVEPAIAMILRQGVADRRRIVGTKPGDAKLTIDLAGISLSLPIRVLEAPSPEPTVVPLPTPLPTPPPTPLPEDTAKGGTP